MRKLYENAAVVFEGRRNGMSEIDPAGSYIGLLIETDDGREKLRIKINASQAESLGRILFEASCT